MKQRKLQSLKTETNRKIEKAKNWKNKNSKNLKSKKWKIENLNKETWKF